MIALTNTPLSFDKAWTMADTQLLIDLRMKRPSTANAQTQAMVDWRQAYGSLCERLNTAIARHLLHLAKTRGLLPAPHTAHVKTPFLEAWRQASRLEPMEDYQLQRLGEAFSKALLMELYRTSNDGGTMVGEALHARLQDKVRAGRFELFETERQTCWVSGESLTMTMTDWAPKLQRFDNDRRDFVDLVAGDIQAPGLQHVIIPVPTGQLLVSDWFLIGYPHAHGIVTIRFWVQAGCGKQPTDANRSSVVR